MPEVLERYDAAVRELAAGLDERVQRLLSAVRADIAKGAVTVEDAQARLEALYNIYEERGQAEELGAVADVLDSFYGWAPLTARL